MAKVQITGGQFQDSNGNPLSNGNLTFTLSHDAQETSGQIVAGLPVRVSLDNNGNVAGTVSLYANDTLTPTGTNYTVEAHASTGLKVWASPQTWTLVSGSAINLKTLPVSTP